MFKKAKLYSLLAIIVASTVVGLFGISEASAQATTATWVEGRENELISYAGLTCGIPGDPATGVYKNSDGETDFGFGDKTVYPCTETLEESYLFVFKDNEPNTKAYFMKFVSIDGYGGGRPFKWSSQIDITFDPNGSDTGEEIEAAPLNVPDDNEAEWANSYAPGDPLSALSYDDKNFAAMNMDRTEVLSAAGIPSDAVSVYFARQNSDSSYKYSYFIYLPAGTDLENATAAVFVIQRTGLDGSNSKTATKNITIDASTAGTDKYAPGEVEESSCQVKAIGWIVCPVVLFMAEITDMSYAILDNTLLKLEPIVLPGGSEGDGIKLYDSWKIMRDFANIVFIIGFLFIVFSQITSIGISNYGIKRLLPKIVIAAILVNLSYYICAIGVDLSNILGNSLRGMLDSISTPGESSGAFSFAYAPPDGCTNNCEPFEITSWQGLVQLVIGGAGIGLAAGAAAGILYIAAPVLLPMLIGAVVAVITVVIALTLRQALVVILIVISPLAFVALLLPNTEDYFKKWRSLFTAMLLVYPIISIVFGASALASRILMGTDDFMVQIVGAGVSIIPLFITPILMKVSGGLLNRWVGLVNDPSKGFFDSKRNALAEQGQLIAARRKEGSLRRTGNFVGRDGNRITRGLLGGANSRRRGAVAFGTSFGAMTRKDNLQTAESDSESAYLDTEAGRAARSASKNAQVNLQNAQLNTESIRLESAEGITLQVAATTAETRKHAAEAEAQTAAITAIPHALEARAKLAETNKKTAEDNSAAVGLGSLAGTTAGQAALARAEDAKNNKTAAEKISTSVGLTGANRAMAAQAENAALGMKNAEDSLAEEVAPLVSQTARVMAKSAETRKQNAVTQAETNATTAYNNSAAGQTELGQAEDAKNLKNEADTDSKAIGIARANEEFKIRSANSTQNLNNLEALDKQTQEEIAAKGAGDFSRSLGIDDTVADTARDASFQSKAIASATSTARTEGERNYSNALGTDTELLRQASGNVNQEKGRLQAEARAASNKNREEDEAVNQTVTLMKSRANPGEELKNAVRDLEEANKNGDVVSARAAASILSNAGTKGNKELDLVIEKIETAGTANDEVFANLKSDLKGSKATNVARDKWTTDEGVKDPTTGKVTYKPLTDFQQDPKNIRTLNEQELAGQQINVLQEAEKHNVFDDPAIQALIRRTIQQSDNGTIKLDTEKRTLLENNLKPVPTSPSAGAPSSPPPGYTAGPSGIFVPSSSARPTSAPSAPAPTAPVAPPTSPPTP